MCGWTGVVSFASSRRLDPCSFDIYDLLQFISGYFDAAHERTDQNKSHDHCLAETLHRIELICHNRIYRCRSPRIWHSNGTSTICIHLSHMPMDVNGMSFWNSGISIAMLAYLSLNSMFSEPLRTSMTWPAPSFQARSKQIGLLLRCL